MPQSIAQMAAFAGALIRGVVPTILAYPTFKVEPQKYRFGLTGVTRNFSVALDDVRRCIDPKPGHRVIGISLVLARGHTVLVADTAVSSCREWANAAADRGKGGMPEVRAVPAVPSGNILAPRPYA